MKLRIEWARLSQKTYHDRETIDILGDTEAPSETLIINDRKAAQQATNPNQRRKPEERVNPLDPELDRIRHQHRHHLTYTQQNQILGDFFLLAQFWHQHVASVVNVLTVDPEYY